MKVIKIGTRLSPLALWQTNFVAKIIKKHFPDLETEIIHIKTQGDKILDVSLSKIGSKGLFTKELETELLAGTIDLAVHSLKDMPTELPSGLMLGAITQRQDARDVLIAKKKGDTIQTLRKNAVVATGSLRRRAQLLSQRKDFVMPDLRGNLQTRIRKFEENDWDGIVLAAAGVERMEMQSYISSYIDLDIMLPAVGQGAICVEVVSDNKQFYNISQRKIGIKEILDYVNHIETAIATKAERAFLRALGGGCQTPIGAYAQVEGNIIHIKGLVASIDGNSVFKTDITGDITKPEETGKTLAEKLLKMGAERILSTFQE